MASPDTGVGRWAPQADFPFSTLAELGLDVDQLEAERAYAIALAAEQAWQQAAHTQCLHWGLWRPFCYPWARASTSLTSWLGQCC